uniref:Uncharacterized protein n=1 Tax=Candidatus Kentrum sp. TUN TaxID=2126343 RepID=A0A450ZX77_9GAMM|nr:MAG: hypothetical protein BECKTUN1418F_GA0071002_105210 [Candidatus Kentron sp. TUN]VFK58400.1 MAG: hypothetical protein BECKTUN1418E_GA0071001_104911 [Candidatus Kentron sp. TUN]VFK58516.1 MAG: hypothetical protein BECKTUN1418D_GA0071000_10845 [Candidatus Kentron sp. TUN]
MNPFVERHRDYYLRRYNSYISDDGNCSRIGKTKILTEPMEQGPPFGLGAKR